MGGLSTSQTPLRRAMLLYVLWNRHIERYADLRFRGETTSPRDVCTWARFRDELCRSNGEFSAANSTIVEPEVAEEVEEAQVVIGEEEGSGEEEKEEGEVLVGDGERDAEAEVYLAWEEERRQAAQKKKASRGLRTHRPHPTRSPSSSRAHNTKRRRGPNKTLDPTISPTPAPALVITWAAILHEDSSLGEELMKMCIEYGYPLDPEQLPQSEQSKLFTA